MKNILIVEDHPFVAQATKSLFLAMAADGHVEICKTADEAVRQLHLSENWFRIFLDINVPGAQGLSLVRHVHEIGLAPRSAIITASDHAQWRTDVESMGFLGYVLKTATVEAFNCAMARIMAGCPSFEKSQQSRQPSHLTRRQIEILGLLHDGLSTKHIARQLNLSPGTVDNHISNLISALCANDRTHAVVLGMQYGYVGQYT